MIKTVENIVLKDFKQQQEYAFGVLYKICYPLVKQYVLHNRGSEADAEDLFQETLIIFYKKIQEPDFQLVCSLKTFLLAISKKLWLKKLRTNRTFQESDLDEMLCEIHDESIALSEQTEDLWQKIDYFWSFVSAHCQQFLYAMFYENQTIQAIQEKYGYSTRHNAQNQKYKCMEQLKKIKAKNEKKN